MPRTLNKGFPIKTFKGLYKVLKTVVLSYWNDYLPNDTALGKGYSLCKELYVSAKKILFDVGTDIDICILIESVLSPLLLLTLCFIIEKSIKKKRN